MKKIITSISILLIPVSLFAQITINQADLPSAGNMYGITNENATATVDYTNSGPNHTWDFTFLTAASTGIDTFFTLSQLPSDFQTYFIGADMADKFGQGVGIGGFSLQGAYTAYNKSGNGFYNRGFGGTVPGFGITLPLIYIPGDQMVKFPLDYNDADLSSSIAFSGVPGVLSINRSRSRSSLVDGWGTLQLPSGNYQVLRMKTDIMDHDSVHIDLLGTDQILDNITHEYKWYSSGKGLPVLQINTNEIGGNETVTQITYQDPSLLPNSIQTIQTENTALNIFPNPASDYVFVMPTEKMANQKMLITDVSGKQLDEIPLSTIEVTTIDLTGFSEGIYFVKIFNSGNIQSVQKLIVNR